MSYYDFDYFWTHEEVGGQKLKVLEKPRRLYSIKDILKFILGKNSNPQNQTKSSQQALKIRKNGTK